MGLNKKYIREAEKAKSFDIDARDLQDLKHKEEIRHLIEKHILKTDKSIIFQNHVNQLSLNTIITQLKTNSNFDALYNLYNDPKKGIGPGEVMLFYILTKAVLGGASSKGVDLIIGSDQYEIKSAKIPLSKNEATGFSLGSSIRGIDVIKRELFKLGKQCNLTVSSVDNIPTSVINDIRSKAPAELKAIEKKFGELCVEQYFSGHSTIFLYNSTMSKGKIAAIKIVTADDITINLVGSRGIEPKIKL